MAKTQFLTRAAEVAKTAPVFRGQLTSPDVCGRFIVAEPMGDGSAIFRRFDDEDLAMQCAVRLGSQVEILR